MPISDMTVATGPPEARSCSRPADVGRIHHDPDNDIWYECVHDSFRDEFTWTIIPPRD
jgi:hypothetical protein